MMTMVIIYALCWLPLHCVTVVGDLQPTVWNFDGIQLLWNVCHWMAVSSCCWNPIVYYWTNDTLRAGFVHSMRTWCPCRSLRQSMSAPPVARRRQVVYQSTQSGNDLQVDKKVRRTASFVRQPPARLHAYDAHRTNSGRSYNMELRPIRASASPARSVQSSPIERPVTRSY